MDVRLFRIGLFQLRRGRALAALLLTLSATALVAQVVPNFSGTWRQDNERCQPKRKGDVTLRIDEQGDTLTVETTIAGPSTTPRHAIQKYTTDGKVSTSTGADRDTFDTSVSREDATLVFTIKEHEDGRILASQERWSLLDGGATLEKIRQRTTGERQILRFNRVLPEPAGTHEGGLGGRDK